MPLLGRMFTVTTALALAIPALAGPSNGDPIPTLSFTDAQGHALRLDAPGVLYLVDFWALGCEPCIAEMPEMERLAREYEPTARFRVVPVVWGWPAKDLPGVAKGAATTRPIFADPANWHDQLGVDAFPTKLLIRDGTVIARVRAGGPRAYARWKAYSFVFDPSNPALGLPEDVKFNRPAPRELVRIVIDTHGNVSEVSDSPLGTSDDGPHAAEFRAAVDAAVRTWRFTPGALLKVEPGHDLDGDGKSDYTVATAIDVVPVYYDVRFTFEVVEGKGVVKRE